MKIAIVQSGPVYLDLNASLDKALSLLADAAREGAELVVFGESWLSGYPIWLDICPEAGLWDHPPVKEVYAKMYENAITVPGPELETLCAFAKDRAVGICIGFNEVVPEGPGNGTIYNSFLLIDEKGHVVNHHRKLMPTFTERLVYGRGDASGLKPGNIHGHSVGGLICWEHWMPLSRQAMHDCGEHIHIALWPQVKEMNVVASRHYAFEGRCYVIAAGTMMRASELPEGLMPPKGAEEDRDEWIMRGGSCAFGPDGSPILEPQYDCEGLLFVDLPEKEKLYGERMTLDTSGHYQRNDIFKLKVKRKRKD